MDPIPSVNAILTSSFLPRLFTMCTPQLPGLTPVGLSDFNANWMGESVF